MQHASFQQDMKKTLRAPPCVSYCIKMEQRKITNPLSTAKKKKTKHSVLQQRFLLFILIAIFILVANNSSTTSIATERALFLRKVEPAKDNPPKRKPIGDNDDTVINTNKVTLVLTKVGSIDIELRSDLSKSSVQYIHQIIASADKCTNCRLYRAEKPGILQGTLIKENVPPNQHLGDCPKEYEYIALNTKNCPKSDPINCGCHGPIMTRGMVGWTAGGAGPDFFINLYRDEADWWENQHTVWGEIINPSSLQLMDRILDLPVQKGSGGNNMHYLLDPIRIELE